ncbi:hypothetical protein DH2020_015401 [Rehmannia glutinosa]|uniref:Uncharacterized protein n=1 Tax=Rehmannia glutinosa TaxID=99300 RepID=A0ABR0WW35_REHGL
MFPGKRDILDVSICIRISAKPYIRYTFKLFQTLKSYTVSQSALVNNNAHIGPVPITSLPSISQNFCSKPSKSLLSSITSSFRFSQNRACSSTPEPIAKSSVLVDYFIGSLKFSKARAIAVSSNFAHIKSLEKPEEVVLFFKALGFSDAHIQSLAHTLPRILFAKVEKTLKPKVAFFQELGLSGPRLGTFVSKNPGVLQCSLDKTLRPCIHLIEKVLRNDGRNRSDEKVTDDLFLILTRANRIVHMKLRLEANIQYLESCGIVGSQLSTLLLRQPRIFIVRKEKLRELVSRAVNMDFTIGSRMLVHAIHCFSCMNIKTLDGRFEVLRMFGFSKDEVALMFRKSPFVFEFSEAKLRWKLEFFLNNLKIDKLVLVQQPGFLTYSIEERVVPRYKVLEILKSKGLLRTRSTIGSAMHVSNRKFLEKRCESGSGELELGSGQLETRESE